MSRTAGGPGASTGSSQREQRKPKQRGNPVTAAAPHSAPRGSAANPESTLDLQEGGGRGPHDKFHPQNRHKGVTPEEWARASHWSLSQAAVMPGPAQPCGHPASRPLVPQGGCELWAGDPHARSPSPDTQPGTFLIALHIVFLSVFSKTEVLHIRWKLTIKLKTNDNSYRITSNFILWEVSDQQSHGGLAGLKGKAVRNPVTMQAGHNPSDGSSDTRR